MTQALGGPVGRAGAAALVTLAALIAGLASASLACRGTPSTGPDPQASSAPRASASASANANAGCDVVLVPGPVARSVQPEGDRVHCVGELRFRPGMEYAEIVAVMPSTCKRHPGVGSAQITCPGVTLHFAGPVWFLSSISLDATPDASAQAAPSGAPS